MSNIDITVEPSPIFNQLWKVLVSIDAGRFRPTELIDIPMRRVGRLDFFGDTAETAARRAAEQLEMALAPLRECVPSDYVDALLEGIAKNVAAHQMTHPNHNLAGVVRAYQREGSWKSLSQQTAIAKEEAERLREENAMLRNQLAAIRSGHRKPEYFDAPGPKCVHELLNEDGICRACGADCRGGGE